MFHQQLCFYHGTIHKADEEDKTFYLDHKVSRSLGSNQVKIHRSTNFDTSNWQLEFHVHTNAPLLAIGAIFTQNPTRKYDQPIVYASRLLNKANQNYTTREREALAMVYVLNKFRHFLLGNNFFFNVDHMALVYLINKLQVSGRIVRWLLFLEYEFIVFYKLGKTHVVVDVLFRLSNSLEPLRVLDQIVDTSLFSIEPIWM